MGFLYLIFGICAIAVSIGKALAVNFGISKYLSKKPYEGDYNFKKVVLYTLGTNYILLSAIVLFILGTIVCSIFGYLNLRQLISGFLPAFVMALFGPKYDTIGDEYGMCSELVIPFFILVILSIPMLFLINYKFVPGFPAACIPHGTRRRPPSHPPVRVRAAPSRWHLFS